MPTIVLHNGHLNVDRNPDLSLHGETGASGELEWIVQFQDLLQERLETAGYAVKRTDGSGPEQDFSGDLFLADHYDGGSAEASYCMAAHASEDTTPLESGRLLACFAGRYPAAVGIPLRQDLVTGNMTHYYGFDYEAQPDLIIEHGNNSNPHDHQVLHGQIALVVQTTFDVIQDYFQGGPTMAKQPGRTGHSAESGPPVGSASTTSGQLAESAPPVGSASTSGQPTEGSALPSASITSGQLAESRRPAPSAPDARQGAESQQTAPPAAAPRPIYHYVLWADSFQFRLPQAQAYVDRFKTTNGWSVDDAAQAQHVTIVGPQHLLVDVEARLRAAGAAVERITGDDTAAPFADLLSRDARFLGNGA